MKTLEGQVGLVTGGARGIGRAIALELAKEGADLGIFDLQAEGLEETAVQVRERGRRVLPLTGDVTRAEDAREAVQRTLSELGRLDILVNNAGITRDGLLMKMREEDWSQVLDVNLKGTFLFSQAVVRHFLKQRSGRIFQLHWQC